MYLCKELTDLSYPEIGKLFNDKHHSTVMYSVEKIEKMMEDDPQFARTVETLDEAVPMMSATPAESPCEKRVDEINSRFRRNALRNCGKRPRFSARFPSLTKPTGRE